MKIDQIDLYQVDYKFADGKYSWSGGHSISTLTTSIVRIMTDEGLKGYGEVCPVGPAYMPAHSGGVPGGIRELAPVLIGQNPCNIKQLNSLMDWAMVGHNYIKAVLDVACWDILGQAVSLPLCTLLGGRYVEDYPLYRPIPQKSSKEMATDVARFKSEGYRQFQLKVGGDPDEDIERIQVIRKALTPGDTLVADANTGWLPHEAIRVVNAVAGEDMYIEQPCLTLEECLVVREHTRLPMVLCELMTGVEAVLQANRHHAMDVVNLKVSRVGGLTKAKQMRDLCEVLGLGLTIEDPWGGDIVTATLAHLVASTQPKHMFSSTDFNTYVDVRVAPDTPIRNKGRLTVPSGPGLGIHVDEARLGKPVVTVK